MTSHSEPMSWEEAQRLLEATMNPYNDRRGRNLYRLSIVSEVAYQMFPHKPSDNPSRALAELMIKLCKAKGAGLGGDD